MSYDDFVAALRERGVSVDKTVVERETKGVFPRRVKTRRIKPTGRLRLISAGRVGRWHRRLSLAQIGEIA